MRIVSAIALSALILSIASARAEDGRIGAALAGVAVGVIAGSAIAQSPPPAYDPAPQLYYAPPPAVYLPPPMPRPILPPPVMVEPYPMLIAPPFRFDRPYRWNDRREDWSRR